MCTRAPRRSCNSFSNCASSGVGRSSFLRTLSVAIRRAIRSASRTLILRKIISLKSVCCSSGRVFSIMSGRVWPSLILRFDTASSISDGSMRIRSVFATYSRLLPIFCPICVWVNLNSFTSRANACARSTLLRSSRWRFSMIASSSFTKLSSPTRIIAGTCESPASFDARSLRSPAINSYSVYRPPSAVSFSTRDTTSGWSTPYWRIDSERSRSGPSSNSRRG